jgi:NitT/TauT family transport system permease protein
MGFVSFLWALAGIVLIAIMWELTKFVGTLIDLPFNTSDQAMPHIWTMFSAFSMPEVRGSETTVFQAVLSAATYSLTLALGGFVVGVSVGLLLAIIMQRFLFLERGLLPFVIASQTVPLIALAPLIVGIGNQISFGPIQWSTTYSVMFIAAYLAFFPLSIGALRGLQAPSATSLELMRSYAASNNKVLWKLRFPASIPYLVPALKVSAAAAVVGTVVAEISTGVRGGIGRLMVEYAREASSQPAKVYVAVFGAIVLGLVVTAAITAVDVLLTRNLPKKGLA